MRANDTSVEALLPFSTDLELRRRFMVLNDDVPANLRFGLLLEHLDKLDFVDVGQRRLDSFAIDKLAADFTHEVHAFVVEKEIDKRFACVRIGRLAAQRHVMPVSQHFT